MSAFVAVSRRTAGTGRCLKAVGGPHGGRECCPSGRKTRAIVVLHLCNTCVNLTCGRKSWPVVCHDIEVRCTLVDSIVAPREINELIHQLEIELCRGRFIALSCRLRPSPTLKNSNSRTRSGAERPATPPRATYSALRPIGISFRMERAVSILIRPSARPVDRERHMKRDGTMERPGFYDERTRPEPSTPRSRYPGSITGSLEPVDGMARC